MTSEDAKQLLPLITAFAEGKTIQMFSEKEHCWMDIEDPHFNSRPDNYRVRPEAHVRPYDSVEEFLVALKQHGPMFTEDFKNFYTINSVHEYRSHITYYSNGDVAHHSFAYLATNCKWQDGTPCGVKE